MDILVVSDSHGKKENIVQLLRSMPKVKYLLFCGDGVADLEGIEEAFPRLIVCAVKGNCDVFSFADDPTERFFEVEGVRILMMHGHTHFVKSGVEHAARYAAAKGADVLLFGHTHDPYEAYFTFDEKRICAFNPGSVGKRTVDGFHYGVLVVKDKSFLLSHGSFQ